MARSPLPAKHVGDEPPSDYLETRVIAIEAYRTLRAALGRLAERVCNDDVELPAYCAALPYRVLGSEAPTVIEPTPLFGPAARAAAADILCALTAATDQHHGAVRRLPGLLAASTETLALIQQVNTLKKDFKDKVNAISPVHQIRNREIRRATHDNQDKQERINLVQCYRLVQILPVMPPLVAFTWASQPSVSTSMTVQEAIERVRQARDEPPIDHVDPAAWDYAAELTLETLAQLPTDELIGYREKITPQPRANVHRVDGTRLLKTVAMPLFYPHDPAAAGPEIRQLARLDLSTPRRPRGTPRYESEPLCPTFGLYRRRPEAR
ncbi:hypothetical protein BJI67_16055 (plasmid) [Acidihalobacter aeolianus]|uniref:DNA replication terminus site-binding protein n=1 Tax=Acidihalobacter aeolianus TaxID=2792603 RepID=A0A1D8KCS2_9GAMM|nr:DNA replication terminus site-binding protein [Acidihalobacter aeolianus]AOV18753.1 hypothetical protein BJI67_16055 [Acidihalobacter aeolianus]